MKLNHLGKIAVGQDGAVWGRWLLRLDHTGCCHVYDLDSLEEVCVFSLGSPEICVPHSNTAVFGSEYYAADDEFPLLYCNVYNNYAREADRREGVCCVYRVTRRGKEFAAELVQRITVGFAQDRTLWRSPEGDDSRPFGNFVIDREAGIYYGYTMLDGPQVTRYFAFRLPLLAEGATVTLTPADILYSFDCPYHRYIQGGCVHNGLIYSVEGFSVGGPNPPALRIIDPVGRKQLLHVAFASLGSTVEPEFIDFRGDTCLYGCKDDLYHLDFEGECYV